MDASVTGAKAESVPSESVISLRGVRAELGSRPVLRGVDLTVRRGEVVALLGANGSGKSTAVRTVIGQVPVSAGEVGLFGTPSAGSGTGHGSDTCRSARRPPAGSRPR